MTEPAVGASVVIPAFNEAETLEETIAATVEALEALDLDGDFEIIIAEDGCTDRTPEVAARLADSSDRIHHLHSEDRLGRGRALERAFERAAGEAIVYFDSDLATDLDHLGELIDAVASGQYDLATGSRLLPESDADRPLGRAIPSRVYNWLAREFLGSTVFDHQCGFKAFHRDALEMLLPSVRADHWFWDTEVLVRAQAAGLEVYEFPIRWEPRGDSTVDVPRDALRMGTQLLGLWWSLKLRPALRRYRGPVALLLTVALGYLVLTSVADPGSIIDEMARADPGLLALAIGLYVLSWPLRGLRYRDILEELGYTEGIAVSTGAIFISQTGNLLVPARAGDAIRAYIVNARRDVPYPSGFASLAIERLFDLLTITALTVGMAAAVLTFRGTDTIEEALNGADVGGSLVLWLAGGVALVAVLGYGLLVVSARIDDRHFHRFKPDDESRLARPIALLAGFLREVRVVATRPGAVARLGLESMLIWSLDVLTAIAVIAAFDTGISIVSLAAGGLLAVTVGNLAKIVPVSPGGIGPYEAAFAIVLVAVTPIGVAAAVAAAIVDHALKNLVTASGGVISTGVLNVSLVTAVREGRRRPYATEGPLRE